MLEQEFDAQVCNGQLVPSEPLECFEGQRVHVTLTAVPFALDNHLEMGLAHDRDVEKDVYVRMPFPSRLVANPTIVAGGMLKPCLIFPEDLPDE